MEGKIIIIIIHRGQRCFLYQALNQGSLISVHEGRTEISIKTFALNKRFNAVKLGILKDASSGH